jgi:hypothetical protein
MPEALSPSESAKRVAEILDAAKALAVEYYQLTGKPLGVTGEVAEYVAAQTLHLKLAPPRTPGHDATRRRKGRLECIQIKGRAFKPGSKFNTTKPCNTAMMVLLDLATLDAQEIWEAPFSAVMARLGVPGSKARARGVLTVGDFKRFGKRVFPPLRQRRTGQTCSLYTDDAARKYLN